MVNNKKIVLVFVAFMIPCILIGTSNIGNLIAQPNTELGEQIVSPNTLGVSDHSYSVCESFRCMTYLDGFLYAVAGTGLTIYKTDAVTGVSIENISIPFNSYGIATDGTDLYLSYYPGGGTNGTIIKMDTSGAEISRFSINVFDQYIGALVWNDGFLWGFQFGSHSLLQINPTTGIVTRNISVILDVINDLTWFNNKLWGVNYGLDWVVAYDPFTGNRVEGYASPVHFDSGITNNGTHMFQSEYISNFNVYIAELKTNPGDMFLQIQLSASSVLDITYTSDFYFITRNSSTYLTVYQSDRNYYEGVVDFGIQLAGITALDDSTLIIASGVAPYNLYTFLTDGTMLTNNSALDVMFVSLAYDGQYLWAMGHDSILYKLDLVDLSIVAEYPLEYFTGITYDYNQDIIWAISRDEHKIKYFDPVKETLGTGMIDLIPPIAGYEHGITFTGEHIVATSYYSGNERLAKIIPIAKDLEPTPTPTPTPTNSTAPGGLIPGLDPIYEDLVFLGAGIVLTSIIAIIIAIARKKKN